MFGPGMAVLLLLLMLGGLAMGEVLARMLPRWGWARGKVVVRRLMLVTFGLYLGVLLTVSLTSHEQVLGHGIAKRFCGFYLDCHLAASVEEVERRPAIGSVRAAGSFYVVKVRVSSDARRATLRMGEPEVAVVDAAGHRYARSEAAERALGVQGQLDASFARPVEPGGSFVRQVVFDLPAAVQDPRLLVKDVRGVDLVLEALLIGDEDSVLHRPTSFKL